ncbi:hypothetical protein SNE40_014449 [Patella caerulea]|uniref:Uncharacterized protein n=1 Tax=Patella caerulea TaxID=87958 RepID=A0AAN8PT72_PATCE
MGHNQESYFRKGGMDNLLRSVSLIFAQFKLKRDCCAMIIFERYLISSNQRDPYIIHNIKKVQSFRKLNGIVRKQVYSVTIVVQQYKALNRAIKFRCPVRRK